MAYKKVTHILEIKKDGRWVSRPAISRQDLFSILRSWMDLGYTEFKITALLEPEDLTASHFKN